MMESISLTNIAKEGLKLDGETVDEQKDKEEEETFSVLSSWFIQTLGNKIEKVTLSKRLTSSPCALVSPTSGWTANMERLIKAQALTDKAHMFHSQKKILEINPSHPIIQALLKKVEADKNDPNAKDIADLLFDAALLTSGWTLDEPSSLASKVHKMIGTNLNIAVEQETKNDVLKDEL